MEPTKSTGPKDVVLHFGLIAALYWSVVHIGTICFELVNRWVPDALTGRSYGYYGGRYGPLRWALAATVVVFPLYLWASWAIERDLARHPEKRGLKTRRWLLYLTLLGVAVTIVGDLVAVIYEYLEGEISLQFILKVVSVLLIAAAVGGYYLLILRRDDGRPAPPWMRWFRSANVILTIAVIVAGFIAVGTPQSERLRRFDNQRVGHLRTIQSNVVSFWQREDRLPSSLGDLRSGLGPYTPPTDPQNRSAYAYRVLGPLQFELCATFRTTSTGDRRAPKPYQYNDGSESWEHDKGQTCFIRTIDPKRYGKDAPPRSVIID